MQVLHDRAASQVKEVLADASIARPTSLPASDMGQAMLHRHPLAQLGTSQRGQLPLAQLPKQSLIWVDRDAAPMRAGGTPLPQGASSTGRRWKVDHTPWREGHLDASRTAQHFLFPVQVNRGLGKAVAIADRPRFTVNRQ